MGELRGYLTPIFCAGAFWFQAIYAQLITRSKNAGLPGITGTIEFFNEHCELLVAYKNCDSYCDQNLNGDFECTNIFRLSRSDVLMEFFDIPR